MTKKHIRHRQPLPFQFTPNTGANPLARPTLLERFLRAPPRSVFLLSAPAGFGKTHVLADWVSRARKRGCAIAWINLTSAERDVGALLRVIADALKLAHLPAVPQIGSPKGDRAAWLKAASGKLLACIERQSKALFLIFDDYTQADSAETAAFLQMLFERMPRNLTLAIASRRPPQISVARLLLEGRLERLEKTELVFSHAEMRAFFASSLSPSQLKSASELTEGWPAALRIAQLCRLEWQRSKTELGHLPRFLDLFTEYALSEVMGEMDQPLRDFLIATSVVDVIEPGLASAVAGKDEGARLLSTLVSSHSIFHAVGAQASAWSLPTLVRLVLRQALASRGSDQVHTMNFRAAGWYQAQGRLVEATRHYVDAGKPDIAVAALEAIGPISIILKEGDDRTTAMLRLLPAEQLAASPRLSLCRLFLDYKQGFLLEARRQHEEISRRTAGFTKDREGGDDARLAAEAAFVEVAMQVYQRSSISSAFLHSMEQKLASAHVDRQLALPIQLVLGMLFMARGDLDLAANALADAEELGARLASPWISVWMRQHFGALALARGQLHEARHQLQVGLKMWRAGFRQDLPYRALTYILLAEIDYELNALAEAQAKLDEVLHSAEHIEGWYELYASMYETASLLALHRDGSERALALLSRAAGVQRIRGLLTNFLPAMRMHLLALAGDFTGAQALARQHRFGEIWNASTSHDQLNWREWDLIGLALCQIAIQTGDLQQAGVILDRMRHTVRLSGRLRSQVRVGLMRADLLLRQERREDALQCLIQALEVGATQGYTRLFLDQHETLRPLLAMLNASEGISPPQVTTFAARLERALPKGSRHSADNGLLSWREREVMRELSLGHSNKLIARKLGLSESTVKFHVQNLFRKLEVRRRASAVAEAHRKGLLS